MHGTLIGAFVTSAGILVGVDSAVIGPGVQPGQMVEKSCDTGMGTVAAIQGLYGFEDAVTGDQSPLLLLFHITCGTFRNSGSAPSVQDQADHLIERLRADLATYLDAIYSKSHSFTPPFGADPHVVYVTVAGYTAESPLVAVRELRLRQNNERWEPFTREVPGLTLRGCGVRFHGEDRVISAMLQKPAGESSPEIAAARLANSGDCRRLNVQTARSLYIEAVRSTVRLGSNFGIASGGCVPNLVEKGKWRNLLLT